MLPIFRSFKLYLGLVLGLSFIIATTLGVLTGKPLYLGLALVSLLVLDITIVDKATNESDDKKALTNDDQAIFGQ